MRYFIELKNNALLLIFLKMAKIIFIFSLILVHILTIVSKNGLGANFAPKKSLATIGNILVKDTSISIFQDDFEHGNLSGWKQIEDWEVSSSEKISGEFSLKHSGQVTGSNSSIFHGIDSDLNLYDLEWSIVLKNGNWDPSSSNRFWFYLVADTIRTELINGWAVGVNITGSTDLLQLWRIKNGKADSLIIQSDFDWNASTQATIYAKRTSRGQWTLNYQRTGESKSPDFQGKDPMNFTFRNIGINFTFTPTRVGQLWVDNISINQSPGELFIQKYLLINSTQLLLTFNKPISPISIHLENFKLTDENNQNVILSQVYLANGSDKTLMVNFGKLQGSELNLSISGVADLSGKTMNPETFSLPYSFSPEIGSVLINEILFNPFSGGVDFVELVNISELTVPVHRLKLASRSDTLALKQIYSVSTEKRYLYPKEYLVCTKDSSILASQYFTRNPESFCVMKTLPSFPDDAGTVVLLNDSLVVLDEFSYSAKMHSPFLADENGVSLERISLEKPTQDRNNWASSAASAGFATPGLPNSQAESETEIQDEITPVPKVFSPNGDGYNDELAINYNFSKPGFIANTRIFDSAGRQVRYLIKNQSVAQQGSWFWNGKNENGQKLTIGVYIILVEVFDQSGQTKAFKSTCAITDRLN